MLQLAFGGVIMDHLDAMVDQETRIYAYSNKAEYIERHEVGSITPCKSLGDPSYIKRRKSICEWFYNVVDHFEMKRETCFIAISFLDRYIKSVGKFDIISEYRLASISSLYLAIKINEPIQLTALTFMEMSRGIFSAEDIITREGRILHILNWSVNRPTPQAFSQYYLHLLSTSMSLPQCSHRPVKEYSCYLIEISATDDFFIFIPSYAIAISSIIVAFEQFCPLISEGIQSVSNLLVQNFCCEYVELPDGSSKIIHDTAKYFRNRISKIK